MISPTQAHQSLTFKVGTDLGPILILESARQPHSEENRGASLEGIVNRFCEVIDVFRSM